MRSSAPQSRARSVARDQHSAPEKKSWVVRGTATGGWLGSTSGIAADDAVPAAPTAVTAVTAVAAAAAAAAAATKCVGQCGLRGGARLAAGMTRSLAASKQRTLAVPSRPVWLPQCVSTIEDPISAWLGSGSGSGFESGSG